MNLKTPLFAAFCSTLFGALPAFAVEPSIPSAVRADGATVLLSVHAEGAQVYQCEADADGKLEWRFREPIATLFHDGKTVGRHYAGPTWELSDGSLVQGKVVGKADGATPSDVAWLKLAAASHKGEGLLAAATTIQRLDTHGAAR